MTKPQTIFVSAFRSPDVFQIGDKAKVFIAGDRSKKATSSLVSDAEAYFAELVMEYEKALDPSLDPADFAEDIQDALDNGVYESSDGVWNVIILWPQNVPVDKKKTRKCKRCNSVLKNGLCSDKTCPFSEHHQRCPVGWIGHPDHPNVDEFTMCLDNCFNRRVR